MGVADRIKECAKSKRLSVSAVCAEIGMSRGYIRDVEAGKIADFLGTTPEYLNGETDEKNKPTPVTESEPKDNNDINLLVQFYKGFSEEQRKELVAEAFRIWQKEQNSN